MAALPDHLDTTSGAPLTSPALRLPSMDGLRAFEAAVRLGTFERAADELHVTASAVGKRINALEELLGVVLLQRGAKALVPTPIGKEYLQQVRAALGLLAAMPLHRRSAQQRQRVQLCAPPTFARLVLVPALPAFAQAHPDVELEILLSSPFIDSPASDATLEVRHSPLAGAAPDRVLMHDHLIPLASPALLAELGPQQLHLHSPEDIARWPLLRTPVEPWAPWFRACGLNWAEPDQGPRLIDLGLTLEAALQAQGVVLARPSLARQALRSGALVPVMGAGLTPLARPDTAYLLSTCADHPLAQATAQWLREACAQAAAEGLALVSGNA